METVFTSSQSRMAMKVEKSTLIRWRERVRASIRVLNSEPNMTNALRTAADYVNTEAGPFPISPFKEKKLLKLSNSLDDSEVAIYAICTYLDSYISNILMYSHYPNRNSEDLPDRPKEYMVSSEWISAYMKSLLLLVADIEQTSGMSDATIALHRLQSEVLLVIA